jgi:hypothetical protein
MPKSYARRTREQTFVFGDFTNPLPADMIFQYFQVEFSPVHIDTRKKKNKLKSPTYFQKKKFDLHLSACLTFTLFKINTQFYQIVPFTKHKGINDIAEVTKIIHQEFLRKWCLLCRVVGFLFSYQVLVPRGEE